jgi:hypothetical protein
MKYEQCIAVFSVTEPRRNYLVSKETFIFLYNAKKWRNNNMYFSKLIDNFRQ